MQFCIDIFHIGSNTGSKQLMKVQLNYISESDCKRGYIEEIGTRLLPQGLISSLLCAGIMEGGKDTCQVCMNPRLPHYYRAFYYNEISVLHINYYIYI